MISEKSYLWKHFENIEDPRTSYLIEHKLVDIVALTILAVICGADSWVEIEEYGKSKQSWLERFLELPNGIPSHDTIARLFARLCPKQLQSAFLDWINHVAQITQGEIIAIDGKTLRSSYDWSQNKSAIHMVSAWASNNNLVLGQLKVEDKSNEITAIPKLLAVLELNGCIVTIDAMGCQKNIAKNIIEKGGDYILSLKGNQGNLFEDVKQLFDWTLKNNYQEIIKEKYETIEKNHGRIEKRRYWLINSGTDFIDREKWVGLKTIGIVESERKLLGQKATLERRYYLTSLDQGVEKFAQGIRSHWGIENKLHWCLDVGFREDESRIRKGQGSENMAVIRHIALNLLNKEKSCSRGKKAKRLKAGWDNDYLLKILSA
ncbi:ISAs1 family transposase [Cyanobacterium sp. Dongsha4]|uniref:ISAs1 family transposase n=1 Tax=Cyanobacterium sp. DS4 TaxID=2878255 RepID=UPI000F2ABF3F|nr:ISAs1 family transposase [Cyanobacterium sp. Dongsha4]RMD70502.1 MAG: ISAs1 family transposase [Cyanobacteria bacterium J149]WVK99221.1 ISAs1 family transposase [Cyanobacterium sp. Dongsha4]WVL00871.1 ISAs1 family transposase [Cyanobacterium sp. Dongsha4]